MLKLRLAIMVCVGVGASLARAADKVELPLAEIRSVAAREYPDLEKIYRHLHSNPELSMVEEKTAAKLAEEFRKAGYEVTEKVGRHGVVAVMKNGPGKTLMIRTDLDALPVREETGAEYASQVFVKNDEGQNIPVMHACGHDVHITTMIGVARAMAAMKNKWKGTLVLIGQPAEEVVRGAQLMLADGLFTRFPRPDYALALHVDGELELGKIGYTPGYALANVDSVDIVIHGVGGHGAAPHLTKDPIVISSQVVLALQTIASRETKPNDPVVVTVGSIHGGTKHNIIPDQVKLQITVRTYKDEVRKKTLASIERIAKGIAMAAGVPKELEPTVKLTGEGTTATYNDPELVQRVLPALRGAVGAANVVEREPIMGAEDFGLYGRQEPKIPIFMFRLGTVTAQQVEESKRSGTPLPSLHSSKYLPQREAIRVGVESMSAAAMDLLK
jgi:amidohydrolase